MSMANPQWGGRRTPRQPAPVSGPGRLSRRTDGGPQQTTQDMTGMAYGENAEFNAIQGAAPLAASPRVQRAGQRSAGGATNSGVSAVPLFAPTGFPEEPVTAGANLGQPMQMTPPTATQGMGTLTNTVRKMAEADPSGDSLRLLAIVERLGW